MAVEVGRRRTEAWSELLARPDSFPAHAARDALLLTRQNVGLEQRARVARSACRDAREAVAGLRRSVEAGRASAFAREWLACLEELLAVADRVCDYSVERAQAA